MRVILIVLHVVIGLGAVGAGMAMAQKPSGESLGFKTEWLEGSPFSSFRIPGMFLVGVIAPTNLFSAYAQWKRQTVFPFASLASGGILLAWSGVQWRSIGFRHWSQVAWYLVFAFTTALAAVQIRGGRASGNSERQKS